MSLVVLIQIDALRHDYVDTSNSTVLHGHAQCGLSGILQPAFGFEPDGAYLAGLYPDECDGGAHFWREPERSPFKFTRWVPRAIEGLEGMGGRIFRKPVTEFIRVNRKWRYEFMPPAPFSVLRQFASAPKFFPPGARGGGIKDIFSLCSNRGISFFFHGSPLYPVGLRNGLKRIVSELFPPVGFAFWHIGDLDSIGHRFGPDSGERKAAMRRVDEGIAEVLAALRKRFGTLHVVIIGDHGMAEVRSHLDIPGYLRGCGMNGAKTPFYFLDSTMARFWFSEPSQREAVEKALGDLPRGRILTQADLDRYHLNYGHNRFGELIFLADAGVLLSPNYFQGRTRIKGMHGYAPECPEQQSAFIINSPVVAAQKFDEPVDMRRIFPTVLKLLGIEKPQGCGVESII